MNFNISITIYCSNRTKISKRITNQWALLITISIYSLPHANHIHTSDQDIHIRL